MTDDKKKLPDIPAEAAAPIIAAAAKISGKAAGDLNLEQAIEILQGDNPNPLLNAYINNGAEKAAGALLDDLTDEQAAQLAEAAQNGTLQEALTAAAQELARQIQEGGTTAAGYSEQQERQILETAAGIAGRSADDLTITEAMRPVLAGIDIAGTVGRALAEQTAQVSKTMFTAMQEYFNSDAWRGIRDTLEMIAATAPAWLELAKEVEELTPYLEAELKKPEYEGKTIDDPLDDAATDDDGNPLETSLFMQALTAARAARDAAAAKEELPHAAVKRAEIIEYPLDKPNSIIWNLLEKDTRGQISFNMAKYGSKQQIPAYYAINFDELGDDITITKRLLPFDKRVYIAVSALFNAGNNVITLSQIYYAMGNTGRPSANQLQKINDAVTKMTTARIYFENEQEAKKYKYPRFKYDGSLLPLERGTAIVNGQLADAAIHIFREPPLIAFAKQRNQITTVDVKLLQSPISKTDANLLIDDYLLERISKAKNGKARSCRILFKTLCAKAGIKTKKQEQRAPAKIEKYLNHYQQQEFITRYTMEKDGITVHW